MSAPSYRFGIEEEYFLADAETRGTPRGDLAAFHARVEAELPETGRELVAAQVELCTPPLTDAAAARENLGGQRRQLAGIAAESGLRLLACGTHPSPAGRARPPPTARATRASCRMSASRRGGP